MSEPANQSEPNVDALLKQYVEDRDSLSPEELDQLIAALRDKPSLAIELRTQLLMDDLLAQKLVLDRRNFLAQVGQRIGDFEQGEEEIFSQVSELRALAEAELVERPKPAGNRWTVGLIGVLASVVAVVAFLGPQYWPVSPREVATVRQLEGNAVLVSGADRIPLKTGDKLFTGTPIEVADGGTLRIEYRDQTSVQFNGGSHLKLVADRKSQAKLVQVDVGDVLASVAPQKEIGPMIFTTPQARAIVVGTEFRLVVSPQSTQLDVTEGKVDFQRIAGGELLRVAANQSGLADGQQLALRDLKWPDDPNAALFVLHSKDRQPLVRNPNSGNPRVTPLEAREPVQFIEGVNVYSLNGGSYFSKDAGEDLVADIKQSNAFTLEAIIIPDGVYRVQDARVLSLADDGETGAFRLLQRGSQLIFQFWSDASRQPIDLKLGHIKADRVVHVTVVFDGSSLAGYLAGVLSEKVDVPRSGLNTWTTNAFSLGSDADGRNTWRGTICDLAITDRALAEFEVAQSAGQYRTLFARRDAGLMWDNLMSDDLDPTRFAAKGNWQIVNDSWQNEAADDAWFGLGPDNLKNYDLLVDVHWVEGDGPLNLTLPVAQRPVKLVLGKSGGEQKSALQDMGGGPMPGAGSFESDHVLPQGRTSRVEVKVRLQSGTATLAVQVDGQPWLDWEGSPDKLPDSVPSPMPLVKKPVLVAAGNVVRIEALKIRDLGKATGSAIGQ